MRTPKIILAAGLIITGALVVSGCTKTVVSTNTAKVTVNNNTVTVNTNAGSYTTGGKVSLPTGFPSDVYVISGTITTSITTKANEAYTVAIETTKSVSDALADYQSKLTADGWTLPTSGIIGGVGTIIAEKGTRQLSVAINETNGKTTVVLGVSQKADANSN